MQIKAVRNKGVQLKEASNFCAPQTEPRQRAASKSNAYIISLKLPAVSYATTAEIFGNQRQKLQKYTSASCFF